MLEKFKLNLLHSVVKCMLSASILFILPACAGGYYQPQVPEHLQDRG